MRRARRARAAALALTLLAATPSGALAAASRVKEIARIAGTTPSTVVGYGLVVGLDGTGDSKGTLFTVQSVANLLQNLGLTVDSKAVKVKNVAAVMVTASVSPFAQPGSALDVTVSSIGDASSLQGGTLLRTLLVGGDGGAVAEAQGPVSIGGYNVQTSSGSGARKNHATVGRVPGGAVVERLPAGVFFADSTVNLLLHEPDVTTALRVAEAVDARFGEGAAEALDPLTVRLRVPESGRPAGGAMSFLSEVENLSVDVDVAARIVLNERTGTIVVGGGVRILPVAVSHGSLSIKIRSTPSVSQPEPFGPEGSATVVTRQDEVSAGEEEGGLVLLESGASVAELAQALNALGVTPRDMIAILQAIRSAGALQAEIVVQ
jgi:flagellar P-ring protein precursor FlgI